MNTAKSSDVTGAGEFELLQLSLDISCLLMDAVFTLQMSLRSWGQRGEPGATRHREMPGEVLSTHVIGTSVLKGGGGINGKLEERSAKAETLATVN